MKYPIEQGACRGGQAAVEHPGDGRPERPVEVLIVEDSTPVRERLVDMVTSLPGAVCVAAAEDGFQAQEMFRRQRPDAVLLDIHLPGIGGLDLLQQFKDEHPACTVVVLTTFAFDGLRQRCAALGADHFFDKTSEFEQAVGVIGALERGKSRVSDEGDFA